jgi:hypothetical protein
MHTVSKTTNTLENLLQIGRGVPKKEEEKICTDLFFLALALFFFFFFFFLYRVCSILEHIGRATA